MALRPIGGTRLCVESLLSSLFVAGSRCTRPLVGGRAWRHVLLAQRRRHGGFAAAANAAAVQHLRVLQFEGH